MKRFKYVLQSMTAIMVGTKVVLKDKPEVESEHMTGIMGTVVSCEVDPELSKAYLVTIDVKRPFCLITPEGAIMSEAWMVEV